MRIGKKLYEQYVYTNEKMPLYCANCRNMGVLLSHIVLRKLAGMSSEGEEYVLFICRCRMCKFSTTVHRIPARFISRNDLQRFLSFKSLKDFGTHTMETIPIYKD